MNKMSKRRRDKYNPYYLEIDWNTGEYFVKFKDVNMIWNTVKINKKIYDEMNSFELEDKKTINEYDRHIDHIKTGLNDSYKNISYINNNIEDLVIYNIESNKLYQILNKLTDKQKRRIYLYYFLNLKEREIAIVERCSIRAVQYSLQQALEKIKKLYTKIYKTPLFK